MAVLSVQRQLVSTDCTAPNLARHHPRRCAGQYIRIAVRAEIVKMAPIGGTQPSNRTAGVFVQALRVFLILLAAGLSTAAQAQTTDTYRYDALGRLTSTSSASYGGGGSWVRYQFDNAGNRTNVRTSSFNAPMSRHELLANEQFVTGQALYSPNFVYELKAMPDGNLVLRTSSSVLWCTGTTTGQTLTVYMGGVVSSASTTPI